MPVPSAAARCQQVGEARALEVLGQGGAPWAWEQAPRSYANMAAPEGAALREVLRYR